MNMQRKKYRGLASMKYNGLRELTPGFQPHTYFLNESGKCWGYMKAGTAVVQRFKKPLFFSKSYRKFDKVFVEQAAGLYCEESRNFVC